MRRSSVFVAALALAWISHLAGQPAGNVVIPHSAWDCGMPGGIPAPESGSPIFEITIPLDNLYTVGKTQYGQRRAAVGKEGSVKGSKLSATVMTGALDYELTLGNGVVEIEDILVLRTTDGKYIYSRSAGAGPDATDVRVVMDFEAPNGTDFEWLNTGKFVARRVLNETARTFTLRVYDVSNVAVSTANAVRVTKPAGVLPQPWENRARGASEKPGPELIVETVTLAPSQRVGASKRGNRNIIPITGGELAGRIAGKVLAGGADYQNLSAPPAIDARYLWQASDGEVIVVRNTTSTGGLVPIFEARVDGPYAFLNTGRYLSSNPGMANGGVKITMYDSTN